MERPYTTVIILHSAHEPTGGEAADLANTILAQGASFKPLRVRIEHRSFDPNSVGIQRQDKQALLAYRFDAN